MKKLLLIFILILLSSSVLAIVNVDIDIKKSFVEEEMISFNYTITSTEDSRIEYTPYIICQAASQPLLEYYTEFLQKNIPFKGTYGYIKVTGDLEPQTCIAYVSVYSPSYKRIEKNFTIDTKPSIVFRILTCKDSACESESKTFIKGSDIHISYLSDIPGIKTESSLTLPDQITKQLILPTSIKAEQIGTYELEVTALKDGYKETKQDSLFAVIEKEPDIEFVGVCNANGICEPGENAQNCPQDCPITEPKTNITIIILLSLIAIVLISFVTYYLYNSRRQQLLEIQNYITNTERKGYTDAQIKAELIRDGWQEKQIDKAFKKLRR